ncbi:MAG TPA: T3SS effector HopA1 family protein [Crinalium sp.]
MPDRLMDVLWDIANHVEIQTDFSIHYPSYKPLELPAETVSRFQHIPSELQQKYLSLRLQSFLYGVYYNGSMRDALAIATEETSPDLQPNFENNTFLGIDLDFYEQLHQSNGGRGYFDPNWQVVRQEDDGSVAVTKGGLTLHIQRGRHLTPEQQSAAIGEHVAIRMPRNLVQNGFYVAVGNVGPDGYSKQNNPVTVRIYFHLLPEGAIATMASLTHCLNDSQIPFNFKVLYNPADYKRYDSGVLYFERRYYAAVRQALQQVYTEHQNYFRSEVPLFTKAIAPGLAVAEEPDRKFSTQESFGMNRCQIVANGLLQAWYAGDSSPDLRFKAIVNNFAALGINLDRPFLNANSDDIYVPL